MLNLCLVVIATQFAETKRRETESMAAERRRRRRRRRSSSTLASCSGEDDLRTILEEHAGELLRRRRPSNDPRRARWQAAPVRTTLPTAATRRSSSTSPTWRVALDGGSSGPSADRNCRGASRPRSDAGERTTATRMWKWLIGCDRRSSHSDNEFEGMKPERCGSGCWKTADPEVTTDV